MKHLDGPEPFPDSGDRDTLYVKLSWDSKAFKMVDPGVLGSSPPPEPSLPLSPPRSPSAAAPASRGPVRRALPTPDPAVIHRASSVEVRCSRVTMSAGRAVAAEAESLHSATKLSASKCLSARRREATARTPGVRKRLQLSSESKTVSGSVVTRRLLSASVLVPSGPDKTSMIGEDVLSQLLDEDLESEVMLAQRLSSSPPHHLPLLAHSLAPLRKANRAPVAEEAPPPRSADVLGKRRPSETGGPPPDDSIRSAFTVLRAGFCGRVPGLSGLVHGLVRPGVFRCGGRELVSGLAQCYRMLRLCGHVESCAHVHKRAPSPGTSPPVKRFFSKLVGNQFTVVVS